jgi:hypothetical protein
MINKKDITKFSLHLEPVFLKMTFVTRGDIFMPRTIYGSGSYNISEFMLQSLK